MLVYWKLSTKQVSVLGLGVFLATLDSLSSRVPLGSENNHFFKWLFTEMAVFVVSGWESGLWPVGISYMLASYCICYRTSSSSQGKNPSLKNRSLGWNWGKHNHTCEQTNGVFSTVLMRNKLLVADCSYLSSIEASRYFSFLSYIL